MTTTPAGRLSPAGQFYSEIEWTINILQNGDAKHDINLVLHNIQKRLSGLPVGRTPVISLPEGQFINWVGEIVGYPKNSIPPQWGYDQDEKTWTIILSQLYSFVNDRGQSVEVLTLKQSFLEQGAVRPHNQNRIYRLEHSSDDNFSCATAKLKVIPPKIHPLVRAALWPASKIRHRRTIHNIHHVPWRTLSRPADAEAASEEFFEFKGDRIDAHGLIIYQQPSLKEAVLTGVITVLSFIFGFVTGVAAGVTGNALYDKITNK